LHDDELKRLVDLTDKELHELYDVWMANFKESRYMADFLFTKDEKAAWWKTEPNFHKPIVH